MAVISVARRQSTTPSNVLRDKALITLKIFGHGRHGGCSEERGAS